MKTLIVCGSRYGSTRVIAQWIAERQRQQVTTHYRPIGRL